MAAGDYKSGLPIRTEADGTDERLHAKIVDGTVPSRRMTVDTDGNAHVEMHGNDPAATDRVLRLSEIGALTPDGVYDVANNTKPGNVGLIASARNATPGDATQTQRLTSVTNGDKRLLDISLHDEAGAAFSETNPLPTYNVGSEGDEVNDYQTTAAASFGAGATADHDYTVTALKTLKISQLKASGSGKIRADLQVETAPASGVYTTMFTFFNSTANPNISEDIKEFLAQVAGAKVRVHLENLDNQAQNVFSTLCGHEV